MKLSTPFTFSQSSLQDYIDCPRRFELRYIEKLNWPAAEAEPIAENERRMADGNFFHRLAQQSLLGLPAEKLSRLANSTGLSADLARWWDNFRQSFSSPTDLGTLYPEATLSAPIRTHRLLAKFDLIAIREGHAVIYDWKTYHKRPRDEWMAARMQTRVYRYLLARAGAHLNGGQPFAPESIQMMYWYAEYPAEPSVFHYDAALFKRDEAALEKLVDEIEALQTFALTSDEGKCRYCPYRSHCNRGATAGDWREAEEEAEVHEAFEVNFEQISEIAF